MPIEVKVPSVGESVTTGVLGSWKKKNGDYVRSGDVLFEIETDKVTSEVYAEKAGKLECLVGEGADVRVGQVVARIDDSAPAPTAAPAENKPAPSVKDAAWTDMPLSPATRRIVEETGADPTKIEGTGKGGLVTKGDVIAHLENKEPSRPEPAPASQVQAGASAEVLSGPRSTKKKMSPLRKKIADRLVSAQHQAAMLTTFNECDMSAVMALRKRFQDPFTARHGIKLGFMSFFVKAVIHALKQVPAINAQIDGEYVVENHFYDIGVAISTDKGLMVPVVRDADRMNLAQVEGAIADYASEARAGKISLADLQGGVFTITNGGVFGSLLSTPIINPPQSAILGMHTIQERPVASNGQVVIRPMMYLALSYDHRLVDGKQAVTFLVAIKDFIENPGVALLELS